MKDDPINWTRQNPRKPFDPMAHSRMLKELADVVTTGILAIQHFTKNTNETKEVIRQSFIKAASRVPEKYQTV